MDFAWLNFCHFSVIIIVKTSAYGARPVLVLCSLSCGSCTVYILSMATNDVLEHVIYIHITML